MAGNHPGDLARAYGTTYKRIVGILKRNKIKLRNISEARCGLTEKQNKELCREYEKGKSTPFLARKYGVTSTHVANMVKKYGKGMRSQSLATMLASNSPTAEQKKEICHRYKSGESTIELGKAFGVGHGTISGILKKNGIRIRSKSEYSKLFWSQKRKRKTK